MKDRRTRKDLEEALIALCQSAGLPYAGTENDWQGLAIDSILSGRGNRAYRIVEIGEHGSERCPFGHAYAPSGEVYARLQFAGELLRYTRQQEMAHLDADCTALENRDLAVLERTLTR